MNTTGGTSPSIAGSSASSFESCMAGGKVENPPLHAGAVELIVELTVEELKALFTKMDMKVENESTQPVPLPLPSKYIV
eukprot:6066055-Amphidinium_carterae.1